jgi:hypothetical protein
VRVSEPPLPESSDATFEASVSPVRSPTNGTRKRRTPSEILQPYRKPGES